jgi:hypothetical protein
LKSESSCSFLLSKSRSAFVESSDDKTIFCHLFKVVFFQELLSSSRVQFSKYIVLYISFCFRETVEFHDRYTVANNIFTFNLSIEFIQREEFNKLIVPFSSYSKSQSLSKFRLQKEGYSIDALHSFIIIFSHL